MGKSRKKNRVPFFLGLVLLGLLAAAAVFMIWRNATREPVRVEEAKKPEARPSVPEEKPPVEEAPKPPEEEIPPPKVRPRVAIVIDDMGQDLSKLKALMEVGSPITIAVLPGLRYSAETAREANRKGLEVILHLPMEPRDSASHDPGKGALLTGMTPEEVRALTEDDLKAVPYAVGINNHMGSRFTEVEPLMRAVIEVAREKRIYFLDSRTSPNSVAGRVAREAGVRNAGRNVFLDNTRDGRYIKGQIRELAGIARKRGFAIGIGHPYPETIEALKESVPALDGDGIEVVRLSEVVK